MYRTGLVSLAVCLLASTAMGDIIAIDSVVAGTNGSPPYDLQSITVGTYTVSVDDLRVGDTDATPLQSGNCAPFCGGTWPDYPDDPAPCSNFDINDILARNQNSNPITVTNFGGGLWSDVNGDNPDFFIFESASGTFGDDDITIQAILPGPVLGNAVSLPGSQTWGDTGLTRTVNPNNGQAIKGTSFAVTDLLDDSGAPLLADQQLKGLAVYSSGIDMSLVGAVVPEPATVALLAVGGLGLLARRKR
ncbi:MAG: PEP-CTERM sorting domain-containing protein [Phycisphaerae bacterium]